MLRGGTLTSFFRIFEPQFDKFQIQVLIANEMRSCYPWISYVGLNTDIYCLFLSWKLFNYIWGIDDRRNLFSSWSFLHDFTGLFVSRDLMRLRAQFCIEYFASFALCNGIINSVVVLLISIVLRSRLFDI